VASTRHCRRNLGESRLFLATTATMSRFRVCFPVEFPNSREHRGVARKAQASPSEKMWRKVQKNVCLGRIARAAGREGTSIREGEHQVIQAARVVVCERANFTLAAHTSLSQAMPCLRNPGESQTLTQHPAAILHTAAGAAGSTVPRQNNGRHPPAGREPPGCRGRQGFGSRGCTPAAESTIPSLPFALTSVDGHREWIARTREVVVVARGLRLPPPESQSPSPPPPGISKHALHLDCSLRGGDVGSTAGHSLASARHTAGGGGQKLALAPAAHAP
jgi:hypothetical protein